MSFTLRRTGLLAAAGALLAPGAAQAIPSLPTEQGVFYVAAQHALVVNAATSDRTIFHVTRSGNTVTIAGSNGGGAGDASCENSEDGDTVTCDVSAGLTQFKADLTGTGDDQVELDADLLPGNGVATLSTGDGDDRVDATAAQYEIDLDLGGGADYAITGSGADVITGGPGADVIEPGMGDDTVTGDAGDDAFISEDVPDGADTFIGGADDSNDLNSQSGDTISYVNRTGGITAVLPPATADAPLVGNGEPGENDAYLGVEDVQGGGGGNTLTGNERSNYLAGTGSGSDVISGGGGSDFVQGRGGADVLDGGPGDDVVDARISRDTDAMTDVDTSITCGEGDDTLLRDYDDPAASGCEHDSPGFRYATHVVTGSPNVGEALSVSQLDTFGDPGTTTVHWISCANKDYEDCKDLPDGATFTPTAAELGRYVYGYADVNNAGLFGDSAFADLVGPIGAALPKPTAAPVVVPTPAPVVTPAGAAAKALGKDVRPAKGITLGKTGIAFFEPSAFKAGKVAVSTKKGASTPVLAVACPSACTVTVKSVVLPAGKKLPKKGQKAVKGSVTLKQQTVTVPAGGAGTVDYKATTSQGKAVKKIKKPTLVITVTTKDASGKTQKATKTYALTTTK